MLGSALQGVALLLYLLYDGLVSLYVISAVFGLFQGGIVPSYAIIVREYFPAKESGTRVGIILMASLFGMALGGWLSGYIFDLTGSYRAAFFNGLGWNAVNGDDRAVAAGSRRARLLTPSPHHRNRSSTFLRSAAGGSLSRRPTLPERMRSPSAPSARMSRTKSRTISRLRISCG